MANLTISHPLNWDFPADRDVRRDWIPQIDTAEKLQLAEEKQDKYDFKSIFYAVGYCREHRFFYTVGPKFLNFEDEVLPLQARYSTDAGQTFETLECRVRPRGVSFTNIITVMKTDTLPDTTLLLELTLANGDKKVFEIVNAPKPHKKIVLNTLQKDNKVEWIIDWLYYYRSLGIFDFHIYDNNSANVDEVIEAISALVPDDTNVHITHWPYRYGIPQFNGSLFSQVSSILDFLYQTKNADWVVNCDIDEYLVFDNAFETLTDFLDSFNDSIGCVQFGCSDAPLIVDEEYPDNLTVRDLAWRTKEIRPKWKNAFRPKVSRSASMHYVRLHNGYEQFPLEESGGFYLHARPLNTGWSAPGRLKAHHSLSSGNFVQETRIAEQMRRLDGIIKSGAT